jgi:ankyrin repeat protein
MLVSRGADVRLKRGPYYTVLQAAAVSFTPPSRHALQMFRMLIELGSPLNQVGGKFGTALQAAAYYCRTDAMVYLIDNGADVNQQGGLDGNALQAAAAPKDYDILWPHAKEEFSEYDKALTLIQEGSNVNAIGG